MCSMWLLAVFGEITSCPAMALAVEPRTSSRTISTSRAVRPAGADPGAQLGGGVRPRPGWPVWAGLGERVVAVGRGQNAASGADGITGQAARIARAVQTLMMLRGHGAQRGQASGERQHPLGQVRVQPDPFKLGPAQGGA